MHVPEPPTASEQVPKVLSGLMQTAFPLPSPDIPVMLASPTTWSATPGVVVPMPIPQLPTILLVRKIRLLSIQSAL